MSKHRGSEKNTYGLPRGDKIRRELRAWFGRQRKAVLHYIATGEIRTKDESGGDLPPSIPDFDAFGLGSLPMSERMVPLIGAIWDDAGQSFNAKLGLDPDSFSVTNPNTKEAVEKAALEFCESTNATTHLELTEALRKTREAIAEGLIVRGDSVADLTKRINEIFSGAETWRARRIAATEASRAVHAAQEMSAIDSEVVTGWKWLLSADACPLCQTVARRVPAVRLGRPFAIIGDNPAYATISHPPLHPGCACSLQEVLDIDPQPEWSAPLIDPKPEEQDYAEGEAPAPKQPKPPAAQKPQALPPKATKPKPGGTPVSGALTVEANGATKRAIESAMASIDSVHGDGALPKIPIKQTGKGVAEGTFWRRAGSNEAIEIRVHAKSERKRMVAAHEIGHFLDYNGVPRPYTYGGERDYARDPIFGAWHKAATESRAYRELAGLESRASVPYVASDGKDASYKVSKRHVRYLMQGNELWARTYSQYIALRSKDPDIKAELANHMTRRYSLIYHDHWDDEDFAPIARAMDAMFEELGWRK